MLKSLAAFVSTLAVLAIGPAAFAQQITLPAVVRIVVPFAPGASTDIFARAVAAQLGPRLGTNVIVENRAGASGFIGAGAVVKGPRDGSMLLVTSTSMVTAAATMRNPPLDVNTDLIPVAMLGEEPLVVAVSVKTDIKSPADLVAAARARPDALTHGTAGVGTIAHLAAELLNDDAKIQLKHIPYKGASLAVIDLASGTINAMIAVYSTLASQVKAGRARLIAVTSREPSPAFPGVPTMASAAPGFEVGLWVAVFAPAGTPAAVVQRLNREINEIAKSKELRDLLATDGGAPLALMPEELSPRVRESYATWKKIAKAKNIVTE